MMVWCLRYRHRDGNAEVEGRYSQCRQKATALALDMLVRPTRTVSGRLFIQRVRRTEMLCFAHLPWYALERCGDSRLEPVGVTILSPSPSPRHMQMPHSRSFALPDLILNLGFNFPISASYLDSHSFQQNICTCSLPDSPASSVGLFATLRLPSLSAYHTDVRARTANLEQDPRNPVSFS